MLGIWGEASEARAKLAGWRRGWDGNRSDSVPEKHLKYAATYRAWQARGLEDRSDRISIRIAKIARGEQKGMGEGELMRMRALLLAGLDPVSEMA